MFRIARTWLQLAATALLLLVATPAVFGGSISVLPIQVCKTDGSDCANSGQELYSAYVTKIWAQASLVVNFLPWATLNNTGYQNFGTIPDETAFFNDTANNGISGNAQVITMWFVKTLTGGDYGTVDVIGGRKVMIADVTFTSNRYDTIAHELGHNLGLSHGNTADFLMNSGLTRTIPTVIGDVNPDGAKLDKLSAAEITTVNSSTYVVPEPGSILLISGGLGILALVRKMKKSA